MESRFQEFTVESKGLALYCRSYSAGTPVLLIHGGGVDADFFSDTAGLLSRLFRVITYDRRGYGRSPVPSDDYSIKTQCEDASAVMRAVGGPFHIIAHSAGSLIALELAAAYPELVRTVLLHEPPTMGGLTRNAEYQMQLRSISELMEKGAYTKAAIRYMQSLGKRDTRVRVNTEEEDLHVDKNMSTLLKHELVLFDYQPNYEKLKQLPLVIGLGELSNEESETLPAKELSRMLSCKLVYFPGRHNCPFDLPLEFASIVTGLIQLSDSGIEANTGRTCNSTEELGLGTAQKALETEIQLSKDF